jgi:alpha-beta hydrolase superfamily lysophospholipase
MSKPTILLVPGSFAPPTIYQTLITLLSKRGYPAVALQLPSTQKRMPLPPATMEEDAETVKRAAETLISQGKDVVVLCHSYGGAPTTQGLANVAVKRIIYLTAVAPRVGQSQIEAMEMEEGFLPAEVGGYMVCPHPVFTCLSCERNPRQYIRL